MPWRESCAMDERIGFIARVYVRTSWTMTELCERLRDQSKDGLQMAVSAIVGRGGGLADRSHAPHRHWAGDGAGCRRGDRGLRSERPSWGPRKIVAYLSARHREIVWPSASTAGEILKRAGLVGPRRVHRARAGPDRADARPRTAIMSGAVDHKGWVRLGDGSRREPLTVTDSFSRYLIAVGATGTTRESEAQSAVRAGFCGLWPSGRDPLRQRRAVRLGRDDGSDGVVGVVDRSWGSTTSGSIPASPSRTAGTSVFTARCSRPCVRRRPIWRRRNGGSTPSCASTTKCVRTRRWASSRRPASTGLRRVGCPHVCRSPTIRTRRRCARFVRTARSNGAATSIHICSALVGEAVGVDETEDGDWPVRFFDAPLGVIDRKTRKLRRLDRSRARERSRRHPNRKPENCNPCIRYSVTHVSAGQPRSENRMRELATWPKPPEPPATNLRSSPNSSPRRQRKDASPDQAPSSPPRRRPDAPDAAPCVAASGQWRPAARR